MPLLMCPNCDGSMQAVQRAGVEFDMCPKCRGVWLDRGELEKLMALEREDAQGAAAPAPAAAPFGRPQPSYEPRREARPEPRYEDHRRYDDDDRHRGHGYHKKKRFDLFDIFD
jgi:Zn-finger nucleic acid-binding protein